MAYIYCRRCSHKQGYFSSVGLLERVDLLVIKEHLLICDLVQHGLISFDQVEPQDPAHQECLQVRFPINPDVPMPIHAPWWIYITTSFDRIIAQWVSKDATVATRTCSAPTGYGVFREINRYLGSIT